MDIDSYLLYINGKGSITLLHQLVIYLQLLKIFKCRECYIEVKGYIKSTVAFLLPNTAKLKLFLLIKQWKYKI